MSSTIQDYLASLRGKRVPVIGIGVSSTPLIKMLLRSGIEVTACDKRQRDDFAGQAEELESLGAELRLGSDYLEGLDHDVKSGGASSPRRWRCSSRSAPAKPSP